MGLTELLGLMGPMGLRASKEAGNKVLTAKATKALLDGTTLLGLVPKEILALGKFFARTAGRKDGFEGIGVVARVPRLSSDGHGRRREVLNLLQLEVEGLGLYG